METTLLRKLTEKSRLNFGKYSELTIQQVLDLKHSGYLRWCYYNLEGISFVEPLLDKLIPQEYKIDKPGKNPELGRELEAKMWNNMYGLNRYIKKMVLRKERRKALENYAIKDNYHFSKAALQRFNHGHM